MTASTTNPKVDTYLGKAGKWRDELAALRTLVLGCGLTEELKWGQPCYTFGKSNIAILQGFKDYCALMFFKGALMKDTHGILVAPGENSRAARQIRFTGVGEIAGMEAVLKAHIHEAVELEKAGLKVDFSERRELALPEELQSRLNEDPALKTAFDALTPGRRRAYVLHFSAPKQSKTRESRVEKCMPRILDGKGLHD
jgi:uncharacterized protein YdeI (YjbR/CyaY-like superfamily)